MNQAEDKIPDYSPPIPTSVPAVPVSVTSKSKRKLLLIIEVALLIIVFCGGAFGAGLFVSTRLSTPSSNQLTAITNTTTTEATAESTTSQTPLFAGSLRRLNQDLKLFNPTEQEAINSNNENPAYYEAGQFTRGQWKDYFRVIVVEPPQGPGNPSVFTLATKDYQSYVLDDPQSKTTKYAEDDWQNPFRALSKSKVTSAEALDAEQIQELNLDQSHALYASTPPTASVKTGKKDQNRNDIYETLLVTDFSTYQKLASPFSNLTIYFKPSETDQTYLNQLSPAQKEDALLRQKYIKSDTAVFVTDETGFPISYSLTTRAAIQNYKLKQAKYEADYKIYEAELKKYNDKQLSQYPPFPQFVNPPSLGFTSKDITSQGQNSFFSSYEVAIPGACSFSNSSKIVNVADADLTPVGSVYNLQLYKLKDSNHPLYTLAYNNKLDYYNNGDFKWGDVNEGITKPTLAEYVNQNPLLFVKDYWGRVAALGEYDIKLPGGCGKPVIYLYPEKEATVSVNFQAPVQFTTDIPTYGDGWKVLANPNGKLVNLKPDLTVCSKIDSRKPGADYAKTACETNTYPYLYWAGNVTSVNYPKIDQGWVVAKTNLDTFLKNKLTEVGLNQNEKNDFMSYWLPAMVAKNAPYYKISFLQTGDLNALFPMTVTPKPNTIFRIFLDYLPLTAKPTTLPTPQTLNKLTRTGFTLVEWGGLKRP